MSKKYSDLEEWIRTSWKMLVDEIINPERKKKNAKDKGIKASIEQLVGHTNFPMSRMTLYNILKYNKDTKRRVRKETLDDLNNFFASEGLKEFEEEKKWSRWSPSPVIKKPYIPLELTEPNSGFYYKCEGCFGTRIDESENEAWIKIKDGLDTKAALNTYSITLDRAKKMAPGSSNEVQISLCEDCKRKHSDILDKPWNEVIVKVRKDLSLTSSELSVRLKIPMSTLHRYTNDFSDSKYIKVDVAKKVLSNFFEHHRLTRTKQTTKNLISQTLSEKYGLEEGEHFPETETYEKPSTRYTSDLFFPSVWGRRGNAMACFFVKQLSIDKDYFLVLVDRAKKLHAKYLCILETIDEEKVIKRQAVADHISRSSLNVSFSTNQFGFQCYYIADYPFKKCEIPQGLSPLLFRRLSDKNKRYFEKLDKELVDYIDLELQKLKQPFYKRKLLKWIAGVSQFDLSSFTKDKEKMELFYDCLFSLETMKENEGLETKLSTYEFSGCISDFSQAQRFCAELDRKKDTDISDALVVFCKIYFASKSHFYLINNDAVPFEFDSDISLPIDQYCSFLTLSSVDGNLFSLSLAHSDDFKNENHFFNLNQRLDLRNNDMDDAEIREIYKLADFISLHEALTDENFQDDS